MNIKNCNKFLRIELIIVILAYSFSVSDYLYNRVFTGAESLPNNWSIVAGFRHSWDRSGELIFHGGAAAVYDIYGGSDKSDYYLSASFDKPISEANDFAALIFRYNDQSDYYYAGLKDRKFLAVMKKTGKENSLVAQTELSKVYETGKIWRIFAACRGNTAKVSMFDDSSNLIGSITIKDLDLSTGTVGLSNRNTQTNWQSFDVRGDISYNQNFDWLASPKEWKVLGNDSQWYHHGGAYKYLSLDNSDKQAISIVDLDGCEKWDNYIVKSDLGSIGTGSFGVLARVKDENNYYTAAVEANKLSISKVVKGEKADMAQIQLPSKYVPKQMWRIEFEADGDILTARLYDAWAILVKTISVNDNTFEQGKAGVIGTNGSFWNSFSVSNLKPVVIDQRSVLFLDDTYIHKSHNVSRKLHQAQKLPEPVVAPDKPWEQTRAYINGTVRYNPELKKFQMWYSGGGMCYAESEDGINWDKPALGLHSKGNSTDTNIVFPRGSQSVFYDPLETDPQQRYKAIGARHLNYMWGAHSPDGFYWTEYDQKPIMPFGSETGTVIRDTDTGKIMAFVRPWQSTPFVYGTRGRRILSVAASDDFLNWSELREIIIPDDIDDQWVEGEQQRTEFYSMSGFRYGRHYVGVIQVFLLNDILDRNTLKPQQSFYEGPIHSQLVHSLDGFVWRRFVDRSPIITNGPAEFDAGCIMFTATEPVIYDDEIWLYYTGINTTHGGTLPPKKISIGRAAWRIDGYASLFADSAGGFTQTCDVLLSGKSLIINADASQGDITVSLVGADDKVLDGYVSQPINTDSPKHKVLWQNAATALPETAVRVRFEIKNAHLYSFYTE